MTTSKKRLAKCLETRSWRLSLPRLEKAIAIKGMSLEPLTDAEKDLAKTWGYTRPQYRLRKIYTALLREELDPIFNEDGRSTFGKPLKQLMNSHVAVSRKVLEEFAHLIGGVDFYAAIKEGYIVAEGFELEWAEPYSQLEALIRGATVR